MAVDKNTHYTETCGIQDDIETRIYSLSPHFYADRLRHVDTIHGKIVTRKERAIQEIKWQPFF